MRRSHALIVTLSLAAAAFAGCGDSKPPAPVEEAPPAEIAHPTGSKFEIPYTPDASIPPLRVEVLKAGDGKLVKKGSEVVQHVEMFVAKTGKKFDSTRDKGGPASFTAGFDMVQPGWDLATVNMRAGDHWKVHVPWQIMYGKNAGPKVPGQADVILDLELLEVK